MSVTHGLLLLIQVSLVTVRLTAAVQLSEGRGSSQGANMRLCPTGYHSKDDSLLRPACKKLLYLIKQKGKKNTTTK